jgi:hypothetical protein
MFVSVTGLQICAFSIQLGVLLPVSRPGNTAQPSTRGHFAEGIRSNRQFGASNGHTVEGAAGAPE